jgi:uncharacterized BrkB/YihY/UPF0761 family membrane protein
MRIKTLWDLTRGAAQDWWEDNCLRLVASLAYYTALSLAPLILLIVDLLSVASCAARWHSTGLLLRVPWTAEGCTQLWHRPQT